MKKEIKLKGQSEHGKIPVNTCTISHGRKSDNVQTNHNLHIQIRLATTKQK